jgi:hypothetical protein
MAANSRARTNEETQGFVKVLADKKTDRMLGVYMINSVSSQLDCTYHHPLSLIFLYPFIVRRSLASLSTRLLWLWSMVLLLRMLHVSATRTQYVSVALLNRLR